MDERMRENVSLERKRKEKEKKRSFGQNAIFVHGSNPFRSILL